MFVGTIRIYSVMFCKSFKYVIQMKPCTFWSFSGCVVKPCILEWNLIAGHSIFSLIEAKSSLKLFWNFTGLLLYCDMLFTAALPQKKSSFYHFTNLWSHGICQHSNLKYYLNSATVNTTFLTEKVCYLRP